MKKALFLSALCSILLVSCGVTDTSPKVEVTAKPVIVTSFYPITHLVETIVGDQATVVQILPQ